MKKRILLLFILLALFGSMLYLIFGSFIKQINFKTIFSSNSSQHDIKYVNNWVEDKKRTEEYIRRNYPNGFDSLSLDEILRFRSVSMDSSSLNIFKNGYYESKNKGLFGTLEIEGEWYTEDDFLILKEKIKKNSLDIVPGRNSNADLGTFYHKVIKVAPDEMIMLLDIEKTRGVPKELLKKADTSFLIKSN